MDVPYFRNPYGTGTFLLPKIQGTSTSTAPWPPANALSTCGYGNVFHQMSGAPEGHPPVSEALFVKAQQHVPLDLGGAHFAENKVRAPDGSRGYQLELGQSLNVLPGEIKRSYENTTPEERVPISQTETAEQPAAKPKRRSRERTSFTSHQKAELEALFSTTQFPDYVTQELLASKIHLQYTVVQIWFKNRRVKWRKSIQKEREAGLPVPAPAVKRNRPRAPRHHSDRGSIRPRVSHSSEPDSGNPDGASPQSDPELDRLVATVPALSSTPYDISQVIEAYGCLEGEEDDNAFSCLYQYLSLSDD